MVLVGLLSKPDFQKFLPRHVPFHSEADTIKEVAPQPRQFQRRLSSTEVDVLVQAYKGGASIRQLLARYGINRTTVLAHLKRRDIPTRANRRKLTDVTVQHAASLYTAGRSLATIGRVLCVDPSTVAKELRQAGVSIRPRRGWPRKHPAQYLDE